MPPDRDDDLLTDIVTAARAARSLDPFVHHYRKIDSEELWTTVSRDLPQLLQALGGRSRQPPVE